MLFIDAMPLHLTTEQCLLSHRLKTTRGLKLLLTFLHDTGPPVIVFGAFLAIVWLHFLEQFHLVAVVVAGAWSRLLGLLNQIYNVLEVRRLLVRLLRTLIRNFHGRGVRVVFRRRKGPSVVMLLVLMLVLLLTLEEYLVRW
jgi:hypothetical protein